MLSPPQLLDVPIPCLLKASHPLRFADLDKHNCLTRAVEVALKQERGIKNDGSGLRVPNASGYHILAQRGDQGMNQRFQPPFLLGVVEYDLRDTLTVGKLIIPEYLVTPPLAQCSGDFRAAQHLVVEPVGIDQEPAQPLELARQHRLSGSDTAAQTDNRLDLTHQCSSRRTRPVGWGLS